MSRENVEVVRRAFEAWNAGDVEGVIQLVDPAFEFIPFRAQLHGDPYVGAEGMRQFARDSAEEWQHLRIEVDDLRDAGEQVVLLGRYDARGRASGVEVEFPAAWVARLRDSKIVHLRAYEDRGLALSAAGLEG